jgi:hypothetical protein
MHTYSMFSLWTRGIKSQQAIFLHEPCESEVGFAVADMKSSAGLWRKPSHDFVGWIVEVSVSEPAFTKHCQWI